MTDLDLTYAHHYEIKEFPELPGTGFGPLPVHYFPGHPTRGEHDGLWIRVDPADAAPWVGVFGFGYGSPPAISRVISTPSPETVCVVSAGAGYRVKVNEPEQWDKVELVPILDVRSIPALNLLVFSTFHKLAALGASGVVWESPRVCWDDLRITRADIERIEGTGYDPTNEPPEMRFSVDSRTGRSLLPSPQSVDRKPIW
jgi:hypothetical protein